MAKIFEVDFRKGSLKDRVSGTFPTNTNVLISQQEKGRAAYFDGTADLNYGDLSTLRFERTDAFSLELWLKLISSSGRFFAKFGDAPDYNGYVFSQSTNYLRFYLANYIVTNSLHIRSIAVSPLLDSQWHCVLYTYDGSSIAAGAKMYVDNVEIATTVITNTLSSSIQNSQGIEIGNTTYASLPMTGYQNKIIGYDHVLSSAERGADYQDFLASTHITKPIVIKSGDATDMIVSLDGTNWNADGGTTNRSLGNLEIATGAFRCLEDATGKYIECTTNGTLTLSGIDLSIFTGNGYLKEVVGDLSGDQGGTVDAASAFAFSSNVLTITMTAAQKLRGFTITASA